MTQLSSLILLAPLLAACSGDPGDAAGAPDAGSSDDGGADVDAQTPVGPDLTCLSQPPPPTMVVDPMTLAGHLVELTTTGVKPVDAADIALFRAGQPVVLARTHSGSNGAFATGAVATAGHELHAYIKGTKPGYRTAFYYPPAPFAASSTTLVVPTLSDAAFATVKTLLGATQDDARNGALLVAVLDCNNHPLPGATLTVRRGMSAVGKSFDLATAVPVDDGLFLVFDVPDGKVHVSATYQGMQFAEHEVVVRASDPECTPPRGTLTSTIVKPGA